MEAPGDQSQIHHLLVKGRRTKRQRVHSEEEQGEEDFPSSSSSETAISGEIPAISTEEEEDMANCLILLAQGGRRKRFSEIAGVYECKTCNRTFPSFQALGGHRASHKKPKAPVFIAGEEPEEPNLSKVLPGAVQMVNRGQNSQGKKVHECSICGLEFTSGQALGGHMRRHRAVSGGQVVSMNRRNILELDLNLPAPEEDLREGKFQFTPTPQTIVFSAPTLVDCHY